MQFRLKLKDGTHVDLLFSMYFLNRVCKLTSRGLTTIFPHLLGDVSEAENGIATGGILDDIEVRAAVVAAGMEADQFAKNEYEIKTLVDGFQTIEKVENSINSTQWAEIFMILTKSLIATLPKTEEPKKKPAPKKVK